MPLRFINHTPFKDEKGEFTALTRMQATRKFGAEWFAELEAQNIIVARLERVFSDRFALFQNLTVPGADSPIPLLMIGPSGARAMYVSPVTGLFEVRGEDWLAYDTKSETYEPTEPNLVQRLLQFSDEVRDFLEDNGFKVKMLEPALLFTDPGIDVETDSPEVRVVRFDGLQRFIQSLIVEPLVLEFDEVDRIIDLLHSTAQVEKEDILDAPVRLPGIRLPQFSRRQWIAVLLLASFNIIIIFVVISLFLSRIY